MIHRSLTAPLIGLGALLVAACTTLPGLSAAPAQVRDGLLADSQGMTLYVFDKDTAGSGKSVCNGPCATNWPPLKAEGPSPGGHYSVVTRDDGSMQLAYKKNQETALADDRVSSGCAVLWG